MSDEHNAWAQVKAAYPIGRKFRAQVWKVEHYGVFVALGYAIIDGYKLSGLIDIVAMEDADSVGLPRGAARWPKVGEELHCKVVRHRERAMEVDLRLVK